MFQGEKNEYSFCPKTYIFPDDYRKFCIDREATGFKHMYILKPSASSCGKGIKVIGQKTQVIKRAGFVCSQYIANPHLIDGLKYDMRVYVVVTCFEPLKIFMLKEGLVRFATQKYSNNPKLLEKRFIHLTNYSINKKADDYVKSSAKEGEEDEGEDASKWNLH
jgi:tubulin polyglutamylase TTLL4